MVTKQAQMSNVLAAFFDLFYNKAVPNRTQGAASSFCAPLSPSEWILIWKHEVIVYA